MARGNPIVHARRGSGRRAEGQYLHPTLSGHLAGHAARRRRRSHPGQEATPSGSAWGELPGPRRGLRGSQRHRGRPAAARLDRRGTRSRRSKPRRFPSTRGTTGTTTTPPASSYTVALVIYRTPPERAVRRPAAQWVGQPWVPWTPFPAGESDVPRPHGVSSTEVGLPSRRATLARHRVVTRVERRDATAGRAGPGRRQAALRANPSGPPVLYPAPDTSGRRRRSSPPARRAQAERVRGGGVRGGVRRAELHSGARCGRRASRATRPAGLGPVGGAGGGCVGVEHARRSCVERWAA